MAERRTLTFAESTRDPSNAYAQSTTNRRADGVDEQGRVNTGAKINPQTGKYMVPVGSQRPDGKFTGDFKGLGDVNPWGGKKSRRRRRKCSRRNSRRRGSRQRTRRRH
jgi:hypothetical protein